MVGVLDLDEDLQQGMGIFPLLSRKRIDEVKDRDSGAWGHGFESPFGGRFHGLF
jgi:hypothetical protein